MVTGKDSYEAAGQCKINVSQMFNLNPMRKIFSYVNVYGDQVNLNFILILHIY